MKNQNDHVLTQNDLEIVSMIAEKYHLSIQEFGRILARKNEKYPVLQILFTDDEYNQIEEKRKSKNLSRSKYCTLCIRKALSEETYKQINVVDVLGKENRRISRPKRTPISFDNATEYRQAKEISGLLGMPFSSLMRYFSLNVDL